MGVRVGVGVRDSAAPLLASQSSTFQSAAGHHVALGMPALCKAASPTNRDTRFVPLKCCTLSSLCGAAEGSAAFRARLAFSRWEQSSSRTAFRAPGECDLWGLPRAALGACCLNTQTSKLIKHAKIGKGRRSRDKLLTPTSRPDLPCVLAPRVRRGPSHHLGRKESVCTHFSQKPLEALATAGRECAPECPGNVRPSFSPYLATARAPCLPCLRPPSPATRAPDALLASDCALPSHVHPCVKTENRYVSVPACLYGEAVARLILPYTEGS